MQFLNNNGFRTAVIVFIIFLAIPFLFTDKQPTALTPQQEASGGLPVGMTKNPLAKFFNRVAGFYGFKKNAGQGLDALNSYANAGGAAQNLGGQGDFPVTMEEGASGAPKGFIATDGSASHAAGAGSAGEVVQEYVRMDGKTFEVVKDPSGKKYVLTDKGPISFDDLMSSTVSREEFEAAKKIAPSLSDDEIPYAIRSPYGVKGYLDRKTQGLLTYEDNPSLFGGPEGNLRGQRGTNLFGGPSGHSMFGTNEEAFDEAKSGLASKYAKVKKDTAASAAPRSIASSYSATGQVNGKYAEPVVASIASLIANKPVIGNAGQAGVVPPTDKKATEENKSASFGAVKRGEEKKKEVSDTVLLDKDDKGIIAESREARDLMTDELRDGSPFIGKYTNCNTTDNCEEKNPWIFPNNIDMNAPAVSFYKANKEAISDSINQNVYLKSQETDKVYEDIRPKIANNKPKIGKMSYLMIDGKEDTGAIKLVNPNSYHYKVFKGLIGNADDVAKGGTIDPKKINPNTTIFVVPDKETANNLKKSGFNVVEFEKYAVTPKRLTGFYTDTLKVVQNMADNPNKKLTASEEAMRQKVVAELSGNNKKKGKE